MQLQFNKGSNWRNTGFKDESWNWGMQVSQQEEDYGWGRIGKKRRAVQWYGSHALWSEAVVVRVGAHSLPGLWIPCHCWSCWWMPAAPTLAVLWEIWHWNQFGPLKWSYWGTGGVEMVVAFLPRVQLVEAFSVHFASFLLSSLWPAVAVRFVWLSYLVEGGLV